MLFAKGESEAVAMKCVEIIILRSLAKVDIESVDELLRQVFKSNSPGFMPEIRVYLHSAVETDLSIHIYWETETQIPFPLESPPGKQLSQALKQLGSVNHSF